MSMTGVDPFQRIASALEAKVVYFDSATSIIAMATKLPMEVIGEAVEMQEELAFVLLHQRKLYRGVSSADRSFHVCPV